MKKPLIALFLTIAVAFADNGNTNIPLPGSYDETGYYRSAHVLVVDREYEFTNNGIEIVSVVVMPGQNLTYIEVGQTVRFTAHGEWLLIYSPFELGDPLNGIKLELLAL